MRRGGGQLLDVVWLGYSVAECGARDADTRLNLEQCWWSRRAAAHVYQPACMQRARSDCQRLPMLQVPQCPHRGDCEQARLRSVCWLSDSHTDTQIWNDTVVA